MNEEIDENEEENEENDDNEETSFETNINNLVKEVQEYNATSNEDKIQNIDKFNSILETINEYDDMLQNYKERLEKIDTISTKKKSVSSSPRAARSSLPPLAGHRSRASSPPSPRRRSTGTARKATSLTLRARRN